MRISTSIIPVTIIESRAAKNYWSRLREKYKARPFPVITGIELINREIIESTETGINFLVDESTIENYYLPKSLQYIILWILKLNVVDNTRKTTLIQQWLFSHFTKSISFTKYL